MLSTLHTHGGNKSPEQKVFITCGFYMYQSYNSVIYVKFPDGTTYLSDDYEYSRTTKRYFNQFIDKYKLPVPTDTIREDHLRHIVNTHFANMMKGQ